MAKAMISANVGSTQAQTARLQKHLEAGNTINPLEAWRTLGIYRLAARIHDLRGRGVKIRGETVKVSNQFGEPCRVTQYSMEVA